MTLLVQANPILDRVQVKPAPRKDVCGINTWGRRYFGSRKAMAGEQAPPVGRFTNAPAKRCSGSASDCGKSPLANSYDSCLHRIYVNHFIKLVAAVVMGDPVMWMYSNGIQIKVCL